MQYVPLKNDAINLHDIRSLYDSSRIEEERSDWDRKRCKRETKLSSLQNGVAAVTISPPPSQPANATRISSRADKQTQFRSNELRDHRKGNPQCHRNVEEVSVLLLGARINVFLITKPNTRSYVVCHATRPSLAPQH
jgi:hypothetical protein